MPHTQEGVHREDVRGVLLGAAMGARYLSRMGAVVPVRVPPIFPVCTAYFSPGKPASFASGPAQQESCFRGAGAKRCRRGVGPDVSAPMAACLVPSAAL